MAQLLPTCESRWLDDKLWIISDRRLCASCLSLLPPLPFTFSLLFHTSFLTILFTPQFKVADIRVLSRG